MQDQSLLKDSMVRMFYKMGMQAWRKVADHNVITCNHMCALRTMSAPEDVPQFGLNLCH